MTPKFRIHFGEYTIADMLDAKPYEIDLKAIDPRLKRLQRFANHPDALNVYQHKKMVQRMVEQDRDYAFKDDVGGIALYLGVRDWADHHDDHEAILGDIIAPVKTLISHETDIISRAELSLDLAICGARKVSYPTEEVRTITHDYDKAAETLEWAFAMGNELQSWSSPCPDRFMLRGAGLIAWARCQT